MICTLLSVPPGMHHGGVGRGRPFWTGRLLATPGRYRREWIEGKNRQKEANRPSRKQTLRCFFSRTHQPLLLTHTPTNANYCLRLCRSSACTQLGFCVRRSARAMRSTYAFASAALSLASAASICASTSFWEFQSLSRSSPSKQFSSFAGISLPLLMYQMAETWDSPSGRG